MVASRSELIQCSDILQHYMHIRLKVESTKENVQVTSIFVIIKYIIITGL